MANPGSQTNHGQHDTHQYPDTCRACAEEFVYAHFPRGEEASRPALFKPPRCTEECWTATPCPRCGGQMNPRGRSAPLPLVCPHGPCPADDPRVNPRHLWDERDDERWRFYPEEAPAGDD